MVMRFISEKKRQNLVYFKKLKGKFFPSVLVKEKKMLDIYWFSGL